MSVSKSPSIFRNCLNWLAAITGTGETSILKRLSPFRSYCYFIKNESNLPPNLWNVRKVLSAELEKNFKA